jgi:hypothetical protein
LLALALPATADAGSLLSGYGGPGQGSQAILGAAVIGGGASGSAGGGTGGGAAGSGSETASSGTLKAISPKATTGSSSAAKAQQPRKARSGGEASASPSTAYKTSSTLSANETAAVATPTLGISGGDLVFIFLAFGALVLTAAITGRLVRRPR